MSAMAGEADDSEVRAGSEEAPRTSMEDHRQTYEAFLNLTKWGIVIVALILIGLAVFLV